MKQEEYKALVKKKIAFSSGKYFQQSQAVSHSFKPLRHFGDFSHYYMKKKKIPESPSIVLKSLKWSPWKTERRKGGPLSKVIKQINPEYLISLLFFA